MIPLKPIDSTWTNEQWQAIYEEGKNIIVSAGAGSGKTAVLTERVIRKLKDGIPINKLLILTFTKAAAGEMKNRIRKKIKKEPTLKENLNLLDSSYITTFDSFALSIVKKYHYLLNISSNIDIIDTNIINLEKEKIMDELFLEYYQEKNELFLKMIQTFCIKDDVELRKYLLNISNKLDLLSNKEEYLHTYLKNYFSDKKMEEDIHTYLKVIEEKVEEIKEKVKEISFIDAEFALKLTDNLNLLYEFKNYDDLVTRLNIKLPIAPRGSEEDLKNKKKEISELIKEIKELSHFHNTEEIKTSILKTYPTIQIIIDIILKFTNQIMQYKTKMNSYEFNDIAILAIKVVKEYPEARKELKEKFQEIMIDEYQDTNDLQEEFIGFIANNNTYMVGDIKQSIYRFRNANPYIFKDKYDRYSNSKTDLKIDLNKNFRSRKEVLMNINLMFILLMNNTIGGADYLTDHQMSFGNDNYLKEIPNHSNDMEIYQYEYDKTIGFTKEEIEAFMIAQDIKEKIDKNYQIFDKDTSELRKIKYDDFAIIMDRATNFDLYKKIFNYFSIPTTLLKDEKMNEESDILVINNVIRFLIKINKKEVDTEFKYLFVSILRSFLFETPDNQIFEYFENKNYKDSQLYQKCYEISKMIDNISPQELLNIILEKFQYYEKIIKIGNVYSNIVKISKLKEMAENLESLGYTVEDFSNYLMEILKNDYKIEYKVPDNGTSAVKMMTIHKSKGLEYPICYFSGLYKEFNISDLKEKMIFDKNLGIITPYFDEGIEDTIYKELLKKEYLEEEISEKIRLFYVALTRAREKIIILTPQTGKEQYDKNDTVLPDWIKMKYRSFSDMLDSISFRIKEKYKLKKIEELNLTKEYSFIKQITYQDKINNHSVDFNVEEIEVKKEIKTNKTFSKKIEKLITKEEKQKMDLGIILHEYLEYLDLKEPNINWIDDEFCKKKIVAFLKQDFLKNIQDATIYQEYEFIYETEKEKMHGIIDLMLEYEDYIDIVDYKLKNIEDDAYQKQLDGYAKYIEKITNKKIHLYLYSLIDEKFLKIK